MNKYITNSETQKELCLTLHEAFIILAQLLDFNDITYFLLQHGFVDENGIPYQTELAKRIFKETKAPEEELEYSTNGKYYFITKTGMKELFNIALSHYLLERYPQLEY